MEKKQWELDQATANYYDVSEKAEELVNRYKAELQRQANVAKASVEQHACRIEREAERLRHELKLFFRQSLRFNTLVEADHRVDGLKHRLVSARLKLVQASSSDLNESTIPMWDRE